jgi:hypothetical protein
MGGADAATRATRLLKSGEDAGFEAQRAKLDELLPALLEVDLLVEGDARTAFVRETAPLIPAWALAIDFAQRAVRKLVSLSYQYDGWDRVARARSEIEAVPDLYAGSVPATYLPELDELDDLLREEAPGQNGLGPDDVPAGIPPSHWWWWAPNDPPTTAAPPDG